MENENENDSYQLKDNEFVNEQRKKKPTWSELYCLKLLYDNFIICSDRSVYNGGTSLSFIDINKMKESGEYSNTEKHPSFFTPKSFSNLGMKRYVISCNSEKLSKILKNKYDIDLKFPWYKNPHIISKDGREYVENNSELFKSLENKINKEIQSDKIIISKKGKTNYSGYSLALQESFGVGDALKVLRETNNRYYVEYADEELYGSPMNRHNNFVEGSHGKYYIDKNKVHSIDVSPESFKKLKDITLEYENYQVQMKKEEEDAIRPILERFKERKKQSLAMFEDEMKSILEPENNNFKI